MRRGSIPHFYEAPGRVLERLELSGAGHARGYFLRALLLEPGEPVRPPGTWMLLGIGEPFAHLGIGGRLRSYPVLILLLGWRVDDARNMARSRQHEADLSAEIARAEQHRPCRRDVVLAGGEIVDRHLDRFEVDRLAGNHHLAACQIVVEVAVAQIEGMIGR